MLSGQQSAVSCQQSAVSSPRLRLRESKDQWAQGGSIPGSVFDLVSRLHTCANTSDSTANEGLTAQPCPLSETSLSRQQDLGTPCAKALAACRLCCCPTGQLSYFVKNVDHQNASLPMSFACSPALFCFYTGVIFTVQPQVL